MLVLEDRVTPNVTASLNAGVLTVTLDKAGDTAFLRVNGGKVEVDEEATFANPQVGGSPFSGVTRIVVQDAGTNADQVVTFAGGTAFALNDGLLSTGVETAKFEQAVNASGGTGAIDVTTGRTIVVTAGLTTNAGGITLSANAAGTASGNFVGVDVAAGTITTTSGNIAISGRGGDSGTGNVGVRFSGGAVVTGGGAGATVAIHGTGGTNGNDNAGILVTGGGTVVTTAGGSMLVTGVGGTGNDNYGVRIDTSGTLASGGSADLTINTDTLLVDATAAIKAGTANDKTVFLQTRTSGTKIDLGGADDLASSPLVLGLTVTELDRVFAGRLIVGTATSGNANFSVAVAPANTSYVTLRTGGSVSSTVVGTAITETSLTIESVSGVGVSGTPIGTAVTNLEAKTTTGGLFLSNTGGVTIGGVDAALIGLLATSGPIELTATGVLNLNEVVQASGDVTITSGANALMTVNAAVTSSGSIAVTTDRITIQAAQGFTSPGIITVQQRSAAWAIDLGSPNNVAANTLELFTIEVGRLNAPTVRIGDATNTGAIALTDDIAVSGSTAALALRSGGTISQTAGKTLTTPALTATGTSVTLDTGSHAVATIAGKATTGNFAFKSGNAPGLAVGSVDGVVGVQAPGGTVTIRSVNDLTVTSAPIGANSKIDLFIADGNPLGRIATVHGSLLTAPNGVTITGGAGSDTFNLKASAATKIDVDGGLPSPPTAPGDTLIVDVESKDVILKFLGPDGSKGNITITGLQPVGFKQIETIQLPNALGTETVVEGTAGDDVLILEKTGGTIVFSLNGGNQIAVLGTMFTFNGLAGNDLMLTKFANGGPALPDGIFFNGDGNTDKLQVDLAGLDADYRTIDGDGGLVLVGGQFVTFDTAEGLDIFAAGTVSVLFPTADNAVTVANGMDFGSNSIAALVVSSPAAAFVPIALWNNATVNIDTADEEGIDGNDTVTVNSANNAHNNTNLLIHTGTGNDTVTINGTVAVAGTFVVDSVAVNFNAGSIIAAGTTAELKHTGTLQLGTGTVSGAAGVTESGGGAVTLTGDALVQSAAGPVSFAGTIDALAFGSQSLTITAATTATLFQSAGATTPLKTLAITAPAIVLNGTAYNAHLGQTYTGSVTVSAPSVAFQSGGGAATFNGTLDGAAEGTSAVIVSAGGTAAFNGPVGGSKALASLTATGSPIAVNGGLVRTTTAQTYFSPVTVSQPTTFESTSGGGIAFGKTLSGGFAVAVNTTGATTFGGVVAVGSLFTSAGGTTQVNGGFIQTNGDQSFNDSVAVGANAQFTSPGGGAIHFANTLFGPFDVTVITAGPTTFDSAVNVGVLATDAAGTTIVRGGSVTTSGLMWFNDPVVVADQHATFTSTGGGIVVFNAALTGNVGVTVNTAGSTHLNGMVSVAMLDTDAAGLSVVSTGLVQTAGDMTFRDAVSVVAAVTFQSGAGALFESTLAGSVDVAIQSPGTTLLGGPVNVVTLATDAPGQTRINGGVVVTAGQQTYGDPVAVGTGTTFASTGGAGIVFAQTLTGPGHAVVVNTAGTTLFSAPVQTGQLVTDAAGTTQVNGGSVVTNGSQSFNDPVSVAIGTTFTAGTEILFAQTLSGPVPVAINAPGATTFGGPVSLASLNTDAAGATVVNTTLMQTSGGQDFADAVQVNAATTFAAGAATFRSTLNSGTPVSFVSGGDVTFLAAVSLGSLTTDAGGQTVMRGGTVDTAASQSYGDAMLLGVTSRLNAASGDLSFLGRLDAEAAGAQGLTALAPGGTLLFASAVGSGQPIAFLAADAVLTRLAADFRATGDMAMNARGGGVEQPAGFLTVATLGLFGTGTFTLDQLGSSPTSGNDITGTFRANLVGPVTLSDSNNLTVDPAGIVSGNNTVLIRTGLNFTAEDPRQGDGRYSTPLVNVGNAEFLVEPGYFGAAIVTYDAEIDQSRAVFGMAGGPNTKGDDFLIRPSDTGVIVVYGNNPPAPGQPLLPGEIPDVLVPLLTDASIAGFTYNGSDGAYTFNNRGPLQFFGIDSLSRRAMAAFVVQTGEPRDATGAVQIQYAVRIVQTQARQSLENGQLVAAEIPLPLPGGLDGKALLQNPFVVSPSFVNPSSASAAPRLAFGDVNGDGAVDLILANGPGTAPLVTVINGNALNTQADGTLRRLEDLALEGQIITQFYAYDPRFLGGVNVTTADLDGDGAAEIITGAEQGGGPHVRIFNVAKGGDIGFYVYEPTFTGGVRLAAGDVNNDGVPDLIFGAGFQGGPRVTVVDGKTLAATGNRTEIANFFAYDPAFRGGIYVDAGDYDNDGFADLLTGPGTGGGPHVRVFSGKTAVLGPNPIELAGFFAFEQEVSDNPLFRPSSQATGIGGVAFSGTSATGSRNILVGTGRGPTVQVKEFRGNGHTPDVSVDLLKDEQFLVHGVNVETMVPNPTILPLPNVLNYGASVSGFADRN